MRNNTKKYYKLIFINLFLTLTYSYNLVSQQLQIDMSVGNGPTFSSIHHDHYYKEYDKVTSFTNTTYTIGMTSKIKDNFFLRSELGLTKIYGNLRVDYEYSIIPNHLQAQQLSIGVNLSRIYLGILPEYRLKYKSFDFFVNAGGYLATDLKYKFDIIETPETNTDILILGEGDILFFGYGFNGGLQFNIGTTALKFSIGGIFFNKSLLFNPFHPYIAYTNTNISFGIVHSIR